MPKFSFSDEELEKLPAETKARVLRLRATRSKLGAVVSDYKKGVAERSKMISEHESPYWSKK